MFSKGLYNLIEFEIFLWRKGQKFFFIFGVCYIRCDLLCSFNDLVKILRFRILFYIDEQIVEYEWVRLDRNNIFNIFI